MQTLIDTDIFCKLGVAGLLEDAAAALRATLPRMSRLPALPHMLRRGSLVRLYGQETCAKLIPVAEALPVLEAPRDVWLQPLAGVPSIDAGEAQLLAAAAERSQLLLSGDKRALRAVAAVPKVAQALDGRIVSFEAILLVLCAKLGEHRVRDALAPLQNFDQSVKIWFSPSNSNPQTALNSYLSALEADVSPIRLWKPPA